MCYYLVSNQSLVLQYYFEKKNCPSHGITNNGLDKIIFLTVFCRASLMQGFLHTLVKLCICFRLQLTYGITKISILTFFLQGYMYQKELVYVLKEKTTIVIKLFFSPISDVEKKGMLFSCMTNVMFIATLTNFQSCLFVKHIKFLLKRTIDDMICSKTLKDNIVFIIMGETFPVLQNSRKSLFTILCS